MNARHTVRTVVRRGLTLIEVLIVIALILAIGGLVAYNLLPVREQSIARLQQADIDNIVRALDNFRLDLNRYPTEEEGLAALWNREALEDERDRTRWRSGGYLRDPVREDRWGNALIYRNPSEIRGEGHVDIVSVGPDGEEGTDDDITNHDRLRDADGEIERDEDIRF